MAAFAEYGALEAKALALQIASDVAHAAAKTAALLAKGADKAAQIAGKVADAAGRTAQTLEAVAARDSAAASSADSAFKSLAAAYARQEAHKIAKIAKATVRVLKKAGHAIGRAAVAVAKAAYKYSGAQDVVGCVTHPSLAGCAKAALTVALTVGTAGEGEVAEIGLNAAEHAGEDIAEQAGAHAAEGAGSEGTVQIFRNVDATEFDSIATTGKFSTGAGQMEGKWFATQGEHAEQWGAKLNGGKGITVETRIPASTAEKLLYHAGKLDGIGPGYYANVDQLNLINKTMNGIRAWP